MPIGLVTKTAGKHYHAMVEKAKSNMKLNEEVFVENSLYARHLLKKRIIDQNLIKYECSECNIKDRWNDKPLVLHLDHINGDSFDNRLTNLRFLCPNCHTQQETYSRGQGKKTNKKRKEELKAGLV